MIQLNELPQQLESSLPEEIKNIRSFYFSKNKKKKESSKHKGDMKE